MHNKNTTVYYANSIAEVGMRLKNIAGITIAAGCTEIARRQSGKRLYFPDQVVSVARIPELCTINKTERYLDLGAAVTLQNILNLGRKNLPDILYSAISGIGHPGIRSLGTLGGNISAKGHRLTSFAPLLALDAKLEIRTAQDSLWIPISRYFSNTGKEGGQSPQYISKIRIPTDTWDISWFRRIGKPGVIGENSASYSFLVKLQKNMLTDIRIAWAGRFFFRQKEYENLMIGRTLPLTERDIQILLEKADLFFDKSLFTAQYEQQCILNLIEESLRMLM